MSLINDALKRAKESQPATTPAPEPEQPMKPVEPATAPPTSRGMPPYFLPAVLIVLSGACWFLIKGWETKRQAGVYPAPVEVKAREIAPAPGTEAANASRQFALTESSQAATSSVAATVAPEPAPEPPRPQTVFRLQGIFYRPSSPSAVINTKTVFIGDIVDEAKVKSIDRQSVTLVHDGQTKVLTLR